MSRNAKVASEAFFKHLDEWCLENDEETLNFGTSRFLACSKDSLDFFINSKVLEKCALSTVYHFSLVEYLGTKFIITHGIDIKHIPNYLFDTDFGGGEVTQIVLEHKLKPRENASTVANFVGAGEIGVNGYDGHQLSDVESIFGPFRKFELDQDIELPFEKLCLDIVLHGLDFKNIWMTEELIMELRSLNQLDLDLPSYNLLRSAQDPDPAGLFLSLYRCIEATYAYKICTNLKSKLGLEISWIEIYKLLDDTAKWRPKELDSLSSILSYGSRFDCIAVLTATGRKTSQGHNKAAEAIYFLRNSLVHFKPYQSVQPIYDSIDWSMLCSAMVGYIHDIYSAILSNSEQQLLRLEEKKPKPE